MIYSIVETLATIMDIVFLIWFIPNFLNTKFYYRENIRFLFLPVFFLTLQLTADFLRIPFDSVIAIGIIVLTACYSFAICQKHWAKAILATSLFVIVIMLSNSMLYIVLSSLISNAENAMQGAPSPARIIYLVIARSTQFVIYKFLLLFFRKNDNLDKKNGIVLLFFSIFTICGLCALMAIAVNDDVQTMNLPVFVMVFVLVLSNIGVYFFIYEIIKMQKKEFEYKLLEERMHFEQIRNEDANAIWDNIRKVRHDLKNHFTVLKAKLSEGLIDDCILYIDRVYPHIERIGNLVHTDNPTLDYLINTKIPDDKNIKVLVSGYTDVFNDMEDNDFASLIGNILDNAFEAVSKLQQSTVKQVELHFLYKNQNRIIICRNTIEKSVLEHNKNLNSSKCGENHGFGHIIVDTIARKYNGFVTYTETDNLFCVQVTFPIAK
ncbi:MAG: ATP-binding protein [Clostridia bacterium]|nr:ATP-binding protein [Clostridia bacterium]